MLDMKTKELEKVKDNLIEIRAKFSELRLEKDKLQKENEKYKDNLPISDRLKLSQLH